MKFLNIVVLILALSAAGWAQTPTPDKIAPAQSRAKSSCPCCQKMGDAKGGKSCSGHDMAAKDGEAMACCAKKDACMKDGKCMQADKKMGAACAKAACCAKDGDKAMACCQQGECPMGGMSHGKEVPVAK